MLVFGGFTGGSTSYRNDLWSLSLGDTLRWTQITPDIPSGAPAARRAHSAIYDPIRDRMIICGGNSFGTPLADVWALSLARTPTWQQLAPSGTFTTRQYHSAVYDSRRDRMVVFGGIRTNTYLNDVQVLSLASPPAWAALTPTGSPPSTRYGQFAVYDPLRDRMVMFGGQDNLVHAERLKDSWSLSFSGTPVWKTLDPDEQVPEGRERGSVAYDPNGDRMIVYGGWDGTALGDVAAMGWDPAAVFSAGSALSPSTGAATGEVTVEVVQTTFVPGMTASLSIPGGPTIPALELGAAEDPTATRLLFDLRGAPPGAYDLALQFPSSPHLRRATAQVVKSAAFTVVAAGEPALWVHIQGRNAIRNGRPATYYIEFGNDGPVDAVGVPLLIEGIPTDATYSISPTPVQLDFGTVDDGVDWNQLIDAVPLNGALALPLVLSRVAAGSRGHVTLTITWNHPVGGQFELQAELGEPSFTHTPVAEGPVSLRHNAEQENFTATAESCAGLEGEFFIQLLGILPIHAPPATCIDAIVHATGESVIGIRELLEACEHDGLGWCMTYLQKIQMGTFLDAVHATEACSEWEAEELGGRLSSLAPAWSQVWAGITGVKIVLCVCAGHSTVWRFPVAVTGSHDPNDKIGPAGAGVPRWMSTGSPFGYRIDFENVAAATAAAGEVVITDPIDATRFDLNSFSLGPITIGTRTISPPRKTSRWTTDVDLRPTTDMLVHIDAALDRTTSIARWGFVSIDPTSGLPSEDPIAGFLPPNVSSPEGEGSVSYSVRPKSGLAEGAETHNAASIVFDANEPIAAPDWMNTLDTQPPSSRVQALEANSSPGGFLVHWGGADGRSGVESYTVFVSRDGGPYEVWRAGITALADTFVATSERVLMFYSIARDSAGNVEPGKNHPEAGTSLSTDVAPPMSVPHVLGLTVHGAHPVRGPLGLELSLESAAPARVAVFDLLGRRIIDIPVENPHPGGGPLLVVSRTPLSPGMYVIRLSQGRRSVSRRVIVVR
jgi:hypothetical protein